jgi:hypothetical protein
MESIGNLKTEEQALKRTIIYSSDIKGLTQDLDHVSIECLTHIRKTIQEALVYLDALDSLKQHLVRILTLVRVDFSYFHSSLCP